jgi:hypothetical protein
MNLPREILSQPIPDSVKFLFGHSSIQTTERCLGSEQEIAIDVNDTWSF